MGPSLLVATSIAAAVACGDDGGPSEGGATIEDGGDSEAVRADFGLDTRPTNATCKALARPPSTVPVVFNRVFNNVTLPAPMMMAQIPGDPSRWFVALRQGNIVSFPTTSPPNTPTPVLPSPFAPADLGSEGGLLGLAFHPKFAQNGRLYVTWTTTGGVNNLRSVVGYLTSSKTGNAYDGLSFTGYQEILGFDQTTAGNHKGGGIAFGKDGLLYLSFGDGGDGDDAFFHGQDKTTFFSKVLRIDVDNVPVGQKYGIPDTNPFKAGGGAPEVFAWGFRNPYRISVDRDSNQLWVGDVGQNHWEEIDRVDVGKNYGWPCREGRHDYLDMQQAHCPSTMGITDPIAEHQHVPQNSRAITGGRVYRGKAVPGFVGTYVYGDYSKQELWGLAIDPVTGEASPTRLNPSGPNANWVSFAEDNDGELYALGLNAGEIFKLAAAAPAGPSTFPERLSQTGCVDAADPKKPAAGLVPYGVNSALWSDGASKERWMALPDGQAITVKSDGDFDFPIGTVLVKSFSVGGKRIETRLFMRHDDGEWGGYSYEWLDDESDAVLLPSSKTKSVGNQTWYYPSRSDCMSCHSTAAGRSLGLELGQQNGDFVYPSTNRISNQLRTLEHIGMLSAPLGQAVDQIVAYPDPEGTAPIDQRARSYLHANCAQCHRPTGPGGGDIDVRFGTSLGATKICNVDPQRGDLGIAGAKILAPGAPEKSILSARPHSPAANRMPPLATSVVDDKGLTVLDDWIRSVAACP